MASNGTPPQTHPAFILPTALLAGAGMVGVALWLNHNLDWPVLLAPAAILAAFTALAFVWLTRFRSARRWQAALDTYAEREIAQAQPGKRQRFTKEQVRSSVLSK
jgi:xanthine/uracil/vitamin C permease (AzgA family)